MRIRVLMIATLIGTVGTLGTAGHPAREAPPGELVRPNDNRRPAGTLRGDTLELRLVARRAMWHPDGDGKPGASIPAFAEEGGQAQIPGPLVRVRVGRIARVTLTNRLADTLRVHGLHDRVSGGTADTLPLVLPPGDHRVVRLRLATPGTFHYWATTTRRAMDFRTLEDAQLTGAIVVDPPGPLVRDRIFVLGMWTDTVHRADRHRQRVLGVINGRSWPNTEQLTQAVGDTVRWRIINASGDLHPMHLHGFYFRVDAVGDGRMVTPTQGRLAVTESMSSGSTMDLRWIPERAGNWLFHCHIPEHFERRGPLGTELPASTTAAAGHGNHATDGMSGLVMGITVGDRRRAVDADRSAQGERRLRLLVRPLRGSTSATPKFGYAVHEHGDEPPVGAAGDAAPTLDVVRGQPVRITVVNRLAEPTAVHWHGIELESYYDGVPGFSGLGRRVTPLIAAGDSFVVRFTPPRAGTFIYHTHADERRQQHAGLAAPLVVSESNAPRDPARDFPLLLSEIVGPNGQTRTVVNGHADGPPLELRVGTVYRFRFVQMSVSRSALRVELLRDSVVDQWRPVAKDGAELPEPARTPTVARLRSGIGETYDFEFTPTAPGPMRIEVRQGLIWPRPAALLATRAIIVRP